MDAEIWRQALAYGGAIALTPLLMRILARAFPAPVTEATPPADARRYSRIEMVSGIVAIVAAWAAIFSGIALRFPNSFWLLGYIFGWVTLSPLAVIAACTLPHGVDSWREFWRFHEQAHRISVRFFGPVYVVLSVIGIISTIVLYAHRNA